MFIWSIFLFFIFSGSHWSEEKLDTWVFHPQAVSDKRDAMLRGVWYMFYVWSKQFLIFCSPFSFNYALPNWDIQANILSDRWPTAYRSISQPHSLSIVLQNHLLTVHAKSVEVVNFFEKLGIYSTRFLCRNCPLGLLFHINFPRWILQAGQIWACCITNRSILKMMIT